MPKRGLAVINQTLWVSEWNNNLIRRINTVTFNVTTYCGNVSIFSWRDSAASLALFHGPTSMVVDPQGNLIVAEEYGNRVRYINLHTNTVTTLAGSTSQFGGTISC